MPSDRIWDEFLAQLQTGVGALARNTVGDAVDQARADALSFVARSEAKLKRWADLLAAGAITREEFEHLVKGQSQLATLVALTALGLAATRLERFRKGLINLVIESAFKAVTP
jgi:hypothetical protein